MKQPDWLWPGGRRIAVVFNIAFEAWSEGKAPGISPMGNPLPPIPGIIDTMAISWAAYGAKRGIYRLLDALARHNARASVMVSAALGERSPEAVKAVADGKISLSMVGPNGKQRSFSGPPPHRGPRQ